jgi:transposase
MGTKLNLYEVRPMNQAKLPMNIPEDAKTLKDLSTQREDVRVRRPVRNQAEMMVRDLESLVTEDHPVRAVWAFLEGLDLSAFYNLIKVKVDAAGRPASDPQVLLALWIYTTVEGIGSARELDRLCNEHDAYRWLRGGVPVDYHILSDFRIMHREVLDELLTRIVGTLMANDLVKLKCVAQDEIKVRASAGAGSFHRRGNLEECLTEAAEQVKKLEEKNPDSEISRRKQAARERATRERVARIQKALDQMASVEAAKERQKRTLALREREKITEARVSTTDPEVRVMKMPDGGWRPAYNVQLATDVGEG